MAARRDALVISLLPISQSKCLQSKPYVSRPLKLSQKVETTDDFKAAVSFQSGGGRRV